MSTSLISLCERGGSLPSLPAEQVSYPETGSGDLARMEEGHFWFVARRQVLRDLLADAAARGWIPREGARGLDIGCGTGFTAAEFTRQGLRTWGVDAYGGFAGQANARDGAGFIQGDIFGIDPAPEFDFVMLLDVLEHVSDHRGFLAQAARFLKPGGMLLITVPAFQSLWSPIDDISGHLRRYAKPEMADLVAAAGGLKIARSFYFFGTTLPLYLASRMRANKQTKELMAQEAAPPAWINTLLGGLLSVERQMVRLGGLPCGTSLFTLLRKSPSGMNPP